MKYVIQFLVLFIDITVGAQTILQDYINEGLHNNLVLQQKQSNYNLSLEQLHEAKALFFPSVSLNARYTVSEGGRVIEFPVGDLLNPVYSTLNQLTASNNFPQLANQEIEFLRPTEHETKLRILQPVFNSDIYYNTRIKRELVVSEQISFEQYQRELITEIKKAYYGAAMTENVLSMLTNMRTIIVENIRVNSKLLENDKITKDILLRSQTELYKFDQQLSNARKNRAVSHAYFNFLLNRSLSDSVIIQEPEESLTGVQDHVESIKNAVANREEIKNLEQYDKINDLSIKMNRAGSMPDIMLVADYGFEGEEYQFNRDQDYLQASAILTWDIFSGLSNRAKIRQSVIRKEIIESRIDETKSRIGLQVIQTIEDMKTAEAGFKAAIGQVQTAREVFRLVNRKYEEGQAGLIEFMDARSTLTQAEENLIMSRYNRLSVFADFENVTAANNKP